MRVTTKHVLGVMLAVGMLMPAPTLASTNPFKNPQPVKPAVVQAEKVAAAPETTHPNAHKLCFDAVATVEQQLGGLPSNLLQAIAMTESGRGKKNERYYAWPWTVTNGKKNSWYLKTKEEAIEKVVALQAAGETNIDVGCMQVNLKFHPDAFDNLYEAFDPIANATYAATLLKNLKQDKRSWTQAVKYYHSANRQYNVPYRRKVYGWRTKLRRAEQKRIRAEVKAAYEARQAAKQVQQPLAQQVADAVPVNQ